NTSNFFENVGNRVRGYVPLVNGNEEEEEWFALSRWQRLVGFGVFLAAGALCLLIAFMTLPMMVLRPAKFAVTFTMGSILILLSFAILHGPVAHIRHVSSRERLPFTIAYFISMAATLYFALGLKSTILALIFGVIQVIALI
ncbi:17985_t:CDS:2, partial [Acaulospora morrowiae]